MIKPHWRCANCDGSRYKIWSDDSISCTKCGYKPILDAEGIFDSKNSVLQFILRPDAKVIMTDEKDCE